MLLSKFNFAIFGNPTETALGVVGCVICVAILAHILIRAITMGIQCPM